MNNTQQPAGRVLGAAPCSALVMPRQKMMDVIWMHRYWRPRALIVGIRRHSDDPNRISYNVITETIGNTSCEEADICTPEEWAEGMEPLRDEYTGKQWRDLMGRVTAPFVEPPEWDGFRKRWAETGHPFEPWIIRGKPVHPSWQEDETYPQNTKASDRPGSER